VLHFFRKNDPELATAWDALPPYMVRSFQIMDTLIGPYPWPQYSFVQGGDGGMEYPMLTMITGRRRLGSLVGVSVHESVHSWFYGVLASNESRHPWMDEGMTEYASSIVMKALFPREGDPHAGAKDAWLSMLGEDDNEPMDLHADHFLTNKAYGVTAYSKGELLIDQLGAVIGERTLADGLRRYYQRCRFRHPDPVDLQRAMEKQSGLELEWYFDEWLRSTRDLDYAVREVHGRGDSLHITLERKGDMLMPVDLSVRLRNGDEISYTIPLSLMLGAKDIDADGPPLEVLPAWQWTDPLLRLSLPLRFSEVEAVVLDPMHRLADSDRSNDSVLLRPGDTGVVRP
jgi:aminopeptidase N